MYPYLFYANGLVEGTVGVLELASPGAARGKANKLDADGAFYARLFGTSSCAFGLMSLVMAKRPDSPEKQIYSAGWLFYHARMIFKLTTKLLTTGSLPKAEVVPYILHTGFTIGFVMYLKNTNFDYHVLLGK